MGALASKWRKSELHPANFFLASWRAIDQEAQAARAARAAAGLGYDYRPLIALASGAALLTAMWYYGNTRTFFQIVDALAPQRRESPHVELYRFAYWALVRVAGMFVLPVFIIRLTRERVRDQGLSMSGLREHLWIYVVLYAIVLALVVGISFTPTFSLYYPIYHDAGRSWFDFGVWELLYAAQFFALEFFFRGYWLKACRDSLGSGAIFAMIAPYCLAHFGKPAPEVFAAIVAGLVLGTLAMKTGSIWCGFLIHVSIGLSMDVAALLQTTGLPTTLWPVSSP